MLIWHLLLTQVLYTYDFMYVKNSYSLIANYSLKQITIFTYNNINNYCNLNNFKIGYRINKQNKQFYYK